MGKEMKVLVISGFLGAGKTTFIQTMVKKTGKSFCILENEYAGSKVDTAILESEDDVKVWEMMEGCICCTMKNSFANKILNIQGLINPDYLIVEATGIGYLSRIISNIQTVEHEWIKLMQAVTIVDADSVLRQNLLTDDLYLDQIRNSQVIAISKSESWSEEDYKEAGRVLKEINPDAEILNKHYRNMPAQWWENLLSRYHDGHLAEPEKEEDNHWDSLTLNDVSMEHLTGLIDLLQDLVNLRYGNVIRVKGILKVQNQWILCDISSGRYQIRFTDPQENNNIVFIGESLDKEGIRKHFHAEKKRAKIQIPTVKGRPYYQRPSNTTLPR